MTMTCRRLLSLVVASASLGACGTVYSRKAGVESDAARVYGGVVFDAKILGAGGAGLASGEAEGENLAALVIPLMIVDLPFSLVADTLLLPVTIYDAATHDEKLSAFHALIAAVESGDVAAARSALDRDSSVVGEWNAAGDSALDVAAGRGDLAMVELLVAAGAEVGFRDYQPFQRALFAGHHDVAIWLHGHGVTPDAVRAALIRAVHALDGDHSDVVAFVLAQHWIAADDAIDGDRNLLLMAARGGNVALITAALDGGADVNHASETGFTALHAAVWSGRPQAVRLLLDRGADVGAVHHQRDSWFSSRDRTPLSTAIDFDHSSHEHEIVSMLRDAEQSARR